MTGLTATKRRAILKELHDHVGAVPRDKLQQIANRHNVIPAALRNLLEEAGFFVQAPAPEPAPEPVRPVCPLNPAEIALLRSARIYRSLDAFAVVCTKPALFHKERQAIIKLLEAFDQ